MNFRIGINFRSWALPFCLSWRFPKPFESCSKFVVFGVGCISIVWQQKSYWPEVIRH